MSDGHPAIAGKSYWDIVVGEFRKNRLASAALVVIFLLFLMAVTAPLVANGRPYRAVHADGTVEYPLFAALARSELIVLLAGVAVPVAAAVALRRGRGRGPEDRGRIRSQSAAGAAVAMVVGGIALTFFKTDVLIPENHHKELLAKGQLESAVFAPIPFSPGPTDHTRINRPPSLGATYGIDAATIRALDRRGVTETVRVKLRTRLGADDFPGRFRTSQDLDAELQRTLTPEEFTAWAPAIRAEADFGGHLLGTDKSGSDVAARLIFGSRTSLAVGFVAVGISVLIGVIYGSIMGYFGGKTDFVMMRFIEIVMSIPTFFLIITIVAFWPRNLFNIMVVIGITAWPTEARFIRAEFLRLRKQDFVTAAEALGASSFTVMFRHMLPNGIAPVLVDAAFGVGSAVFIEASLSFLGFGPGPDVPSWGAMLSESFSDSGLFLWWISMFPGFAIFVTVLCYNLVGEGLRDALDPRLRKAAA